MSKFGGWGGNQAVRCVRLVEGVGEVRRVCEMNGDAKLPPKGKTIPETGFTFFALISLQIA